MDAHSYSLTFPLCAVRLGGYSKGRFVPPNWTSTMAVSLRMAAVAFSPDPYPSGVVETGAALLCRAGAWPAGCSVTFPMQIVKELRRILGPACRLVMSPCRAPCPQGAGLPGFHRLQKDGAFCWTGDPVSPYGNFHFCYEIYSEVLRGGGWPPGGRPRPEGFRSHSDKNPLPNN